jgi:predicted Zn-dependent protease
VKDIQPTVAKLKAGRTDFATNREDFVRRIDGIVYGDNPEQGIVRGAAFLHPVLRFRLDFPEGWEIQNTPSQVAAKAPGADVFMVLQLVQNPQGRNLQEIAVNSMRNAGFQAVEGAPTRINNLEAFLGVYQGQAQDGSSFGARAAHIAYDQKVYIIVGLAPAQVFRQADPAISASIRTFRSMTAAEAENIHPSRVDLYVVRAGDTWASIAERSGGLIKPAALAVMNNSAAGTQPVPGTRIKIVVGG